MNSSEESSFEFAEWLDSTPTARLRVIIVYRPPYSHTHPVIISTFITAFANFLESVVLLNEQTSIYMSTCPMTTMLSNLKTCLSP